MNPSKIFISYFLFLVIGLLIEVIGKKIHFVLTKKHYRENHFTFGKYIVFLSVPMAATILLFYVVGWKLIYIVITFGLIGTFMEWLAGWSYHQIMGQRLWTYHRYAIGGYTSWLSLLFWGISGGLFYILASIFI